MVLEQPNQNYHESITNLFQRNKHCLFPWCSLLVKLPQPRWPSGGSRQSSNRSSGHTVPRAGQSTPLWLTSALCSLKSSRDRPPHPGTSKWLLRFRSVTWLFPLDSCRAEPSRWRDPNTGPRSWPEELCGTPVVGATASHRAQHGREKVKQEACLQTRWSGGRYSRRKGVGPSEVCFREGQGHVWAHTGHPGAGKGREES